MSNMLVFRCKVKIFSSISMVLFGLAVFVFSAFMIVDDHNWWWSIGVLFGIFCIYQWGKILLKGSMSVALVVSGENLYVTFKQTKEVVRSLEEISNLKVYTNSFKLSSITHLWRYTMTINGSVTSDYIKIFYQNKETNLLDFNEHEVALKQEDLDKMLNFLHSHNPLIYFYKPH